MSTAARSAPTNTVFRNEPSAIDATKCACGGRIEPTTNGSGAVVDQCVRCGAPAGRGRAPAPPATASRTTPGTPCRVEHCPGALDAFGVCACCARREKWLEANMPKRHCEICGGNIKGTRKLKYCKACKEIANQVAIAKHHAEIASKK